MKVIAIDGSPRKHFNTAALVDSFIEGVKIKCPSAECSHIHLYDLTYKGCVSCLGCRLSNSKTYGVCIHKDDITPVIAESSGADILVLASPIYFGDINGAMHSFLERLLFPYETYEAGNHTIAPHRMPVVTIYTMNVTEDAFFSKGYNAAIDMIEHFISNVFTKPQRICSYNTCQVRDYSHYRIEVFSEADKLAYHKAHWDADNHRTFDMGKSIVSQLIEEKTPIS